MALKSRNLSYAYKYLNFQINHHKNCLKDFDNPNSTKQPDCVRKNYLDKLFELEEQMEWCISGDFCKFNDGHKEEIIHWKQWDTKPMVITFLTPTGIYKFEKDVIENYDIKGNSRITIPTTSQFYKYIPILLPS